MSDVLFSLLLLLMFVLLLFQALILHSIRRGQLQLAEYGARLMRNRDDPTESIGNPPPLLARRIKYRARGDLKGDLEVEGSRFETTICDISETGALLRCPNDVLMVFDRPYLLQIRMPAGDPLHVRVRCVRKITDENSYGCQFDSLTIEAKKRIRIFVNQQAAESLHEELHKS